jgi:hypothetical protein
VRADAVDLGCRSAQRALHELERRHVQVAIRADGNGGRHRIAAIGQTSSVTTSRHAEEIGGAISDQLQVVAGASYERRQRASITAHKRRRATDDTRQHHHSARSTERTTYAGKKATVVVRPLRTACRKFEPALATYTVPSRSSTAMP